MKQKDQLVKLIKVNFFANQRNWLLGHCDVDVEPNDGFFMFNYKIIDLFFKKKCGFFIIYCLEIVHIHA